MAGLISIILPTRDRRRLLEQAVASVLAQTTRGWELIIVDDGSSDDTWSWIESRRDARILGRRRLAPAGRSAARNVGLGAARGDAVLYLDDDDVLAPTALQRLGAALTGRPSAVAAVGGRTLFDDRGQRVHAPHVRVRRTRRVWYDVLFGWVPCQGQALIRASALRQIGGFDEGMSYAEDHELWLQLARLGPVVLVPHPAVETRVHPAQSYPPADVADATKRRVRLAAASSLSEPERGRALAVVSASSALSEARQAYLAGDFAGELDLYWRAVREAPSILRSPLTRRLVTPLVVKAMIRRAAGQRAAALLTRTARRIRVRMRRAPLETRSPSDAP